MENFARPAFHETMPVAAARWLPSSARRTHARPSSRNHDPLPTAHAITISISLSLTQSTNFLSVPLLCRPFLPTRSSLSLPQAALSLPPSSAWRPVAPAESDLHTRAPVPRTHHGHRLWHFSSRQNSLRPPTVFWRSLWRTGRRRNHRSTVFSRVSDR